MSLVSPETHSYTYNRVAFKASHNSYERNEMPITTQLNWSKTNPHQKGCRGLELDIHQSGNLWLWSVSHLLPYRGDADWQFSEYLILLKVPHPALFPGSGHNDLTGAEQSCALR